MKCSKCGFENADSLKFCNDCGQKLTIVCPSCQATNQAVNSVLTAATT